MNLPLVGEGVQWVVLVVLIALVVRLIYRVGEVERLLPQPAAFISLEGLARGTEAPPVPLADQRTGLTIDIAALHGAQWVLLFMGADCPHSAQLVPGANAFIANHPELPVLVVVRPGSEVDYQALISTSARLAVDTDNTVVMAYDVPYTPWMVVVDEGGFVVRNGIPHRPSDLEDILVGRGRVGRVGPVEDPTGNTTPSSATNTVAVSTQERTNHHDTATTTTRQQ